MTNAVEVRDICKSYSDFTLDHVTFDLPAGSIFGLVGENGAGKSTTIQLLLDIIKKDEGRISVLGHDPSEKDKSWKNDIGVVLDAAGLPHSLNANQISTIMRDAFLNWDNETYKKYLERFQVPENKTFSEMSNGTKMKLSIAIALSHDAKLLILDEATNALDPLVRNDVNDILMEFTRQEDHSVLISSHIVTDLEKLCDYIAFLHKGKLVLCEEKDILASKYGTLSCSRETLNRIDSNAILHVDETSYGCNALVRREEVPFDIKTDPITIEDLFVLMAKEEISL